MGGKEYNIEFVPNFKPSDLEPKKVWRDMKDEYVKLNDLFQAELNKVIGPLNDVWEKNHPKKENSDDDTLDEEAAAYGLFMMDNMNKIALMIGLSRPTYEYLFPVIVIGEEGALFGCRVRQHLELLITHKEKKSEG